MSTKTIREMNKAKITDLVNNKKPFTFIDNSGCAWNDHFMDDITTDEDCLIFLAKYRSGSFVMERPQFGNLAFPSGGLVKCTIPYENILLIIEMELGQDKLEKLKSELPGLYEYYNKQNFEEVSGLKDTMGEYKV